MHSSVETVDLRDVENVVKLVAAFAKSVTADADFSR
jgi:putative aminopeptidase FrvX